MPRTAAEIFERLGSGGLARALDDLMDKPRLARLATVCDLKYPGVRIRSVKRDRLLTDLVKHAEQEERVREAIQRALNKETRAERGKWDALSANEKAQRLGDAEFLRSRGNLGRHLWFLASSEDDGDTGFGSLARQHLQSMLLDGAPAPSEPKATRAEQRLKRRVVELEKKIQHQETQLTRSRESEKRIKRDLIERKGELAETRMLAQRLRRERDESRRALESVRAARPDQADAAGLIEPLERAVKRVSTGQRKLTHVLEKLKTPSAPSTGPSAKAVETITEELAALRKDLAAMRRERKKEQAEWTQRLDEVAGSLKSIPAKKERRPRVKEEDKRVGVFIDVQNVYYGARKLKGLLDFDALMDSAVAGRRLIQSTAYVVETKEIDQSWFIARLQQKSIEVRRKTLRIRADGSSKGDWDMELALDILDAAPKLDVVVLVSGDGDFTSLVKRVKRIGPRIEVIAFPRTTAKALLESADRYQPLDRKFMIYKRPKEREHEDASKPTAKPAAKSTVKSAKPDS